MGIGGLKVGGLGHAPGRPESQGIGMDMYPMHTSR